MNEVVSMDTEALATALARSFYHHPLEALSDAVFLAHAFDSEARQVQGEEYPRGPTNRRP